MFAILGALVLAAMPDLVFADQDGPTLAAILDLPRGRVYVGQGIEAWVVVAAGAQPPTLSIGKADGVEVLRIGGIEVQARSSTEIGAVRNVVNTFRLPLRILPRKDGPVATPAIRVQVEGRAGVVPPRTIMVLAPPAAGRSAAFLGGVGTITATAEARPTAVRLGESFEYRVTLDGPGSIGSVEPASIPALRRLAPGWRVERLPPEGAVDPPSRTFRIRVRPDLPGTFNLGPFLVSTLDPTSGTYRTTATNSVTIRVVDVPVFDGASIKVAQHQGRSPLWAGLVMASGLIASALLVLIAKYRAARSRTVDPARVARQLIARLPRDADRSGAVNAATAALAEFLGRVGGRPPGVLTPQEASRWAVQLSGRSDLAEAASRLVASCDQTLYANRAPTSSKDDVLGLAVFVLEGLGESSEVEKPREAPGTA